MSMALLLLVCAMVPTKEDDHGYKAVYQRSQDTGTMLVSVGAEWCPGCVLHKKRVRDRFKLFNKRADMWNNGHVYVDVDAQPKLSSLFLVGNTIPQVSAFKRIDGVWYRRDLIGSQVTDSAVENLEDWLQASESTEGEKE